MQTRRRLQMKSLDSLPHLPVAVQLLILDKAVAQYPVPENEEYVAVWPYRSSLCWLLALGRVHSTWHQHLQQHPTIIRRIRLEKLHNLSLVHIFAYHITSSTVSKQQRINRVPRQICLHFADGSNTTFDVPKGGVGGASKKRKKQPSSSTATPCSTSGLPTHALMLVAHSHHITSSALLELLSDLDTLDQHHAAPMVLQVRNICTESDDSEDHEHDDGVTATKEGVDAVGGSFAALEAAVLPALSEGGALKDIVKEGDSSCEALTFIPTKQGFRRRLPAA